MLKMSNTGSELLLTTTEMRQLASISKDSKMHKLKKKKQNPRSKFFRDAGDPDPHP